MADLVDVPTRELLKEILTRMGRRSTVEVEIGAIMMIGYYPHHLHGARFKVAAESHQTVETTDIEVALDAFYRLYRSDDD